MGRTNVRVSCVAVLVRLQAQMGAERVRWRPNAARTLGPHMEARYRSVQQVSVLQMQSLYTNARSLFFSFVFCFCMSVCV